MIIFRWQTNDVNPATLLPMGSSGIPIAFYKGASDNDADGGERTSYQSTNGVLEPFVCGLNLTLMCSQENTVKGNLNIAGHTNKYLLAINVFL